MIDSYLRRFVEFVGPGVDDRIAVEVTDGDQDSIPELLFGRDTDVTQPGARQLGEEALDVTVWNEDAIPMNVRAPEFGDGEEAYAETEPRVDPLPEQESAMAPALLGFAAGSLQTQSMTASAALRPPRSSPLQARPPAAPSERSYRSPGRARRARRRLSSRRPAEWGRSPCPWPRRRGRRIRSPPWRRCRLGGSPPS